MVQEDKVIQEQAVEEEMASMVVVEVELVVDKQRQELKEEMVEMD